MVIAKQKLKRHNNQINTSITLQTVMKEQMDKIK